MRFGLYVAPFGDLADAAALADVAAAAEAAGWEGFFVWDHTMYGDGVAVADPWVALTAVALATRRLRLGPLVTPLARRRPWDVARQAATLDHLSGGRLVLGVGLGSDRRRELSAFGEELDARSRARILDEALGLLTALWEGRAVDHRGERFELRGAQVLPTPAQAPRPPIWVADVWPHRAPLARAARYDGVFPIRRDGPLEAADLRELLAYVDERRGGDGPFDVVVTGRPGVTAQRLGELAGAGATWWLSGLGFDGTRAEVEAVARAGPPQWSA